MGVLMALGKISSDVGLSTITLALGYAVGAVKSSAVLNAQGVQSK